MKSDDFSAREADFNFGWLFALADPSGAEQADFDDSAWRELRLPHDWSVEFAFDKEHGEGCTGYLPGGIGWYRKHFRADANPAEKKTFILFDGVYNNARVWINGHELGFHPYGYSPFYYDLTPYLNTGDAENVVAVRVDHSRYADSRWFTGSGIYRNVKLITVDRLHVPIWGTRVTTPEVSAQQATVALDVRVKNDYADSRTVQVSTRILDPQGRVVAGFDTDAEIAPGSEAGVQQEFAVSRPSLWSVETPALYRAVTQVVSGGEVLDEYVTRFGIRSIRFDPDEGFFLNGVNMKIKGVCLHHDGGLVGAAVPDGVWRRRLEKLREGGCNAIRAAHNPPSEAFLDLCDEMGFLVQDEFFDEWDYPKDKRLNKWETKVDYVTRGYGEHFHEWAERDLKSTMLRDRNHPSIIQWSIGNEIEWTYPAYSKATGFFDMDWKGNYFWSTPPHSREEIRRIVRKEDNREYTMAGTAEKLATWTRKLDTTRPVALNSILPSASHESGVGDVVDILGYSYRRVVYDYGHENYPDKVIMGTENLPQWHEWKAVIERPFISGTFLWTGIDYMGESNEKWPRKTTPSGLLDQAGFPKGSWHMYRTLWNDAPHVFLATQTAEKSIFRLDESTGKVVEKKPGAWERALWFWHDINEHWNYDSGELVIAEVYTNCAEVELLLNGRSLGVRRLAEFEDRILRWAVPFEAGVLEARSVHSGEVVGTKLVTTGQPAALAMTVDRAELTGDGYDVAHVVVQLVDKAGEPVRVDERRVTFEVEGGRLLGVDNGAPDNVQTFQTDSLVTSQGRCLMIVEAPRGNGTIRVRATSEGLEAATAEIQVR